MAVGLWSLFNHLALRCATYVYRPEVELAQGEEGGSRHQARNTEDLAAEHLALY